MLTRDLAITEYDFAHGRIFPDRLTRTAHRQYLGFAEQMLAIYRNGTGQTRRDLHRAIGRVLAEEEDCPTRRIGAFCKLLDDVSKYDRDRRGQAAELRRKVFHMAAPAHPLVTHADRLFERAEEKVKAEIAGRLGQSWQEIDARLFADVIDFHRLNRFDGYPTAGDLLARYNVAQVQAALYSAVRMTVWASTDFKTILRYAKLARLMHTIDRTDDGGYRIHFDGPASVLRQTRRYGVAMAKFLPALLACKDWRMHAVVETRRGGHLLSLDLSSADGLNSHLPPPGDFDSGVERAFAERWGAEPREGWQLIHEGRILHQGQKVFVPDFLFRHADGREVPLEIVGFWTPEYLAAKSETLRRFADHRILLAVAESVKQQLPDLADDVIPFKTVLKVKDVLARLIVEAE